MRDFETPPQGQEGSPDQTRKLALPMTPEPPAQTQKISLSSGTAAQTQISRTVARPRRSGGWKPPAALGAIILLGGAAYLVFSRGPAARSSAAPAMQPDVVAPGAQSYLDQAKVGDAHAMRMLGVMYYYGLNVPQDREKGLYWYRKAAEMGSDAARQELAKLEGRS